MVDVKVLLFPLPSRANTNAEIAIVTKDEKFIANYGSLSIELEVLNEKIAIAAEQVKSLRATLLQKSKQPQRVEDKNLTDGIDRYLGKIKLYNKMMEKFRTIIHYAWLHSNRCLAENIFFDMVRPSSDSSSP